MVEYITISLLPKNLLGLRLYTLIREGARREIYKRRGERKHVELVRIGGDHGNYLKRDE